MTTVSGRSVLFGRIISAHVIAFLLFDAVIKLIDIEPVRKSFIHLGYSPSVAFGIGIVGIVCAVLYAMPRTAMLGAVLITALCGGAVASHLRIDSPLFTHILFGVYVAVLAWGGLWLRDARLRSQMPMRQS